MPRIQDPTRDPTLDLPMKVLKDHKNQHYCCSQPHKHLAFPKLRIPSTLICGVRAGPRNQVHLAGPCLTTVARLDSKTGKESNKSRPWRCIPCWKTDRS